MWPCLEWTYLSDFVFTSQFQQGRETERREGGRAAGAGRKGEKAGVRGKENKT